MKKRRPRRARGEVFPVEVGHEKLVVMSVRIASASARTGSLTPAEREIARLALTGHSNAAIARRRGSSARTVANQLASVYRKLKISSRTELAARFSR